MAGDQLAASLLIAWIIVYGEPLQKIIDKMTAVGVVFEVGVPKSWLKSRLSGIFTADSAVMVRHVHDYEMQFLDKRNPLDYALICKCGDVAPSMEA